MKQTYTCPRCDGKKVLKEYAHIAEGICFKCNGTGIVTRNPDAPKKMTAKQIQKEEERKIRATENCRKLSEAVRIYRDEVDAKVGIGHPYAAAHAREMAMRDGIWDSI